MKAFRILYIVICVIVVTNSYAQPHRIYPTNVYWEIVMEGNDSTIKFTGTGTLFRARVFYGFYKHIKKVEICEGITEIGTGALQDWTALEKVILPQSLRTVGAYAFYNDSNIKSINIPENLDVIYHSAFSGTGGLPDSLYLSNIVFWGNSIGNTINGNTFARTSVKYVEFPYKVDTAFTNFRFCSQLVTVVIPATIKKFVGTTFYNDSALSLVVNLNPVPQTFSIPSLHAFYLTNQSKCRLIVPTSAVETYKNTPVWKDFMIEGGGLSAGVTLNAKEKGNIRGYENRFYKSGEKITWKAEPKSGCSFSGWRCNGEWLSTSRILSFTITKDTLIEAVFDGEVAESITAAPVVMEKIHIFPNPSQDKFTVNTNAAISQITLFDLSGRQIKQVEQGNIVNVENLAKGVYVVKIQTEQGCCVRKIIKQ